MKNFNLTIKESAKELKGVKCITISAMLGALAIVLGFFSFYPLPTIRVGLDYLPSRVVYYLFGPVVGAVYGAAIDILKYFIKPMGPYHPGFTLSSILSGIIFGMVLYKKPLKISRVFVATTIKIAIVNIILNTYWNTAFVGETFWAILPARVVKNLIMLPFETLLVYILIKGIEATGVIKLIRQPKASVNKH